ncbi:MAG: 4'-phosphopantetheinyl transferase superfamily protein [Chitinophagaceae bacterium]|nr:4'-phosphopantetheinyl transferase superfamily protein [Chitinophagaceae bacterium]
MPIFYQHQINDNTRLGVWKIEETEEFFKGNVPHHRDVTHPHKRLQHLAGRFLLQYLFPYFPYELIEIADTRKPFIPDERFHFSISHCGDYAAAIVSKTSRVGVDIEIPSEKVLKIQDKYLSKEEREIFNNQLPAAANTDSRLLTSGYSLPTLLWSAKEAVFKWYGAGEVDFRKHTQLKQIHTGEEMIDCLFTKLNRNYRLITGCSINWCWPG